MAQGAIGSDNDDLLLLTLGINTDEDDFSKARNQIKLLQDAMKDTENSFNLGNFVSSLNKAVQALKLAVNLWNGLENKALSVGTNTNYLPFGASAGEIETIRTKIDSSKVAQANKLSSGGVLSTLAAIASEQANVRFQGADPNQKAWISLTELANELGDKRFQGSNLSNMLTKSTSIDVLMAISDLMSNASRWAYSAPEGAERQRRLQLWNQVKNSPYFNEGMADFIANLTKPENQTWGRSGNVMAPYLSGAPEDLGTYGDVREKSSSKSLNISEALNYLKTDRDEVLNTVATGLYNSLAESYVLPASRVATTLGKAITGRFTKKYMTDMPTFEAYGWWDKAGALGIGDSPIEISKEERKVFSSAAGLNETGDFYKGNLEQRAAKALSYYTGTENALLGELGLYELAKMTQANYAEQSLVAMTWARDKLVKNVTGNMTDAKGKRIKAKDAFNLAEEMVTDPNGIYSQAFASGGFTGLASALYKNKALTEKEYADFMAKIINDTKHKEITKYYSDVKTEDEVTATTKTERKGGVTRTVIELQIVAPNGEKTVREVTPEELSSVQLRL